MTQYRERRESMNGSDTKAGDVRRETFIRHFMIHGNASRAYREAGYHDGPGTRQSAHRLLTSAYVQDRLAEEAQEQLSRLDVTVEAVLQRYKDIAFSDISQLSRLEIGACRYCWGKEHRFQWRTEREWEAALAEAAGKEQHGRNAPILHCDGGFGYRADLPPHPDCPECDGHGIPRVILKDTRCLTEAERAVFAGVEVTRYGARFRFSDRSAALNRLAQHLQFFAKRDAANANAFADAVAEIIARGSKMPLRKSDPERHQAMPSQ